MTCATLADTIRRLLSIYQHLEPADLEQMIRVHSCQTCHPIPRYLARDPEERRR